MLNGVNPPLEEVLEHFGVKGMQWGVRKKHSTSPEIRSARNRQQARAGEIHKLDKQARKAPTASARSAAAKKRDKAKRDFDLNEDRVTAARITHGEKVALAVIGGPLGLVGIGVLSAARLRTQNKVDEARARA